MMRSLKGLYLGLVYFFFYLPLAILIVYSFNNGMYSSAWHGFTLKWYVKLAHDPNLLQVTGHSLLVAFCASSMALILGTIAAVSLMRYQFFSKNMLQLLIFILIVVPDLVLGIALLILYYLMHIKLGFSTLLIAHITLCLPFVIVTLYSRLGHLDSHILEAAADLGAHDTLIFRRIIIPLLAPALLSAWLLSFTLSMDDVIISFFVSGPSFQVLPLQIYSMVRLGIKPEINALCSIIFTATLCLVAFSFYLLKRSTQKVNTLHVN